MMVTEQDKTLAALQFALQMEIDGKEYYLKASRESGNELGKRLLASLADEEDFHRQKFEQIYQAIRSQKAWPEIALQSDRGIGLRTVFARATEELGSGVEVLTGELDAVEVAMAMENKSYDYYKGQEQRVGNDTEMGFYRSLAAEERGHHMLLLDYAEYLKDPAGWFVKKEHPSLDGG